MIKIMSPEQIETYGVYLSATSSRELEKVELAIDGVLRRCTLPEEATLMLEDMLLMIGEELTRREMV